MTRRREKVSPPRGKKKIARARRTFAFVLDPRERNRPSPPRLSSPERSKSQRVWSLMRSTLVFRKVFGLIRLFVTDFSDDRASQTGAATVRFVSRGFADRRARHADTVARIVLSGASVRIRFSLSSTKPSDELIFEIDEADKNSSVEKIKFVMENVHLQFKDFQVPLLVDYGFGNNWGDAH